MNERGATAPLGGNRIRVTWPGGFHVTTGYDALGRPTDLRENGTTLLAHYDYDDLSRRTTVTLGNGTVTSYGYDAQGRLSSLAHNLAGTADDVGFGYLYNPAGEIRQLTTGNPAYQWNGPATNRHFAANGLDQYTGVTGLAPSHDANGNWTGDGTWHYVYDRDNRPIGVTGPTSASLAWDAEGRLSQTGISSAVTHLLYDGEALVAEYGALNQAPLRRYVHGPGIDEPLVQLDIVNGAVAARTWFHADHLGSVIARSDAAGNATAKYAYGPFGEPATTSPIRFGYTGQQTLAGLNLYHYKARTYSPTLGRFLQTDPVGTVDGLNRYRYVGNSPVNATDPSGLYWFRQAWQTPGVVGRDGNIFVPPRGPIGETIEKFVPAGYTFGEMHDKFVDLATGIGIPFHLINIPSMIPTYGVAVITEVLRSAGILEQPKPPEVQPASRDHPVMSSLLTGRK